MAHDYGQDIWNDSAGDESAPDVEMTLHSGESCLRCIRVHVGPAVESIAMKPSRDEPQRCGGCGRDVPKFRFTYWFPWSDGVPT